MNVTIIGAGLVGSLLSVFLAKRGYKVNVFERRPDLRKHRISAGKSINLALSDRGRVALRKVGIEEKVLAISLPMKGRMIHNLDGKINFQPYGKENEANYSVSRGGLNCLLMDIAGQNGVKFSFEHRCTGVDLETSTASFISPHSSAVVTEKSDIIFSADGAFSAARLQFQLATDRFTYSQDFLNHGYKELLITPAPDGDFALDPGALHIWPRGQFMLIALPNLDKTFTCTLFFPFEGEHSFASLNTPDKVLKFFKDTFPDVVPLMPTLPDDYFRNPASSLVTVRCFPWSFKDKVLLLGDAAHAIVPFFGQGMNAGFEDCVVLDKLLEEAGTKMQWESVFKDFETLRKPDADAIADLAIENYLEMRDKVSDEKFLLRKKIESRFSSKYPAQWIPLYSMVTYRPDIRYSQALTEGRKQEEIMRKIMAMPDIEKKWDSGEVEMIMLAAIRA